MVTAQDQHDAFPDCGALATRVHQRIRQRVKDIPIGAERAEVIVVEPRWICGETACRRRTFTLVT